MTTTKGSTMTTLRERLCPSHDPAELDAAAWARLRAARRRPFTLPCGWCGGSGQDRGRWHQGRPAACAHCGGVGTFRAGLR